MLKNKAQTNQECARLRVGKEVSPDDDIAGTAIIVNLRDHPEIIREGVQVLDCRIYFCRLHPDFLNPGFIKIITQRYIFDPQERTIFNEPRGFIRITFFWKLGNIAWFFPPDRKAHV